MGEESKADGQENGSRMHDYNAARMVLTSQMSERPIRSFRVVDWKWSNVNECL